MKQKLKWYAPLNRWLTEYEHQAHVLVEPELKAVYASIMVDAMPAEMREPEPQPEPTIRLDTIYGLANIGSYSGAYLAAANAQQNALNAMNMANQAQVSHIQQMQGLAGLGLGNANLFGSLFR